MSEVSLNVAEMLLSTESIAVYKDHPFVFVSGRISPVYIDCRKLLSFSAERDYIVTHMAKKVENDIGVDKKKLGKKKPPPEPTIHWPAGDSVGNSDADSDIAPEGDDAEIDRDGPGSHTEAGMMPG